MSFQTTAMLLTWAAIILLGLVVAGLVRQVHALTSGVPATMAELGLPQGSVAPGFERLAPPAAAPTVLLFLEEECTTCPLVLQEAVEALHRNGGLPVAVRAIFPGPAADPGLRAHQDIVPIFADETALFAEYGIPVTPFAIVVDPSGRVRSTEALGSPTEVRALLDRVAESTSVDLNGGHQ